MYINPESQVRATLYGTCGTCRSDLQATSTLKRMDCGPPKREPQESSSNMIGIRLAGFLYSLHVPTTFFGFPIPGPY